jgi:hypothetical protein
LVEEGTHDQLVELGGLYSKLHELQFSREHAVSPSLPPDPLPPATGHSVEPGA